MNCFFLGCWGPRRQLVKGHLCCQVCWVTESESGVNGMDISHPSSPQAPPLCLPSTTQQVFSGCSFHMKVSCVLGLILSAFSWMFNGVPACSSVSSHSYVHVCVCIQPRWLSKYAKSASLCGFFEFGVHGTSFATQSKGSFVVVSGELLVIRSVLEQRPPWWWWTAGRASRRSN